ncbi:MAG: hypothetical protein GXN92_02375 [Candidatus Micrarchaeota archaeon]|nr:hypothetical protein [Candidatus Micrarchaeota archaeon]
MQKRVRKEIDIIGPRPHWDRMKERVPRKIEHPPVKSAPFVEKEAPSLPTWAKAAPYASGLAVAAGLLIALGPAAIVPALVIGGGVGLLTKMKIDEHFFSQ